jgi:hypothetical protein
MGLGVLPVFLTVGLLLIGSGLLSVAWTADRLHRRR